MVRVRIKKNHQVGLYRVSIREEEGPSHYTLRNQSPNQMVRVRLGIVKLDMIAMLPPSDVIEITFDDTSTMFS